MLRAIDVTHGAVPVRRHGRQRQVTLEISERDALLRSAVRFYPAGCSDREISRRLREAICRYKFGRWRRSCVDLQSPHPAETIETLLWQLLRVRDAVPGDRTVRLALRNNSGVE